jgi:phage repressor protein C with HTH and peptisase S24 domain
MAPYIVEGDELLVSPAHLPKVNDIVLAQHPTNPTVVLIKMVDSIRDGEFYLTGINQSSSSDSRDFGWLSNDLLLGRITSRIST